MKKLLSLIAIAVLAFGLVAIAGCSSSSTPATPPASTSGSSTAPSSGGGTAVTIASFAFSPADVTIKAGGTVTWTNNDSVAHTVTGSGFDSGQLAPGATFSHTFDTAGSYDYKCSNHPSMTAKVTVQ